MTNNNINRFTLLFTVFIMITCKFITYSLKYKSLFNCISTNNENISKLSKLNLSSINKIESIDNKTNKKRKKPINIPSNTFTIQSKKRDFIENGQNFIKFLNDCPEPFNCVKTISNTLLSNNFIELYENEPWIDKIKPNKKYFFTRNGSSIVAFAVGPKYIPGNGFKIIGAHTDSPNLKIKPNSKRINNGLVQLNVECYGGGLWHTWFDRDLSLAGRVIVSHKDINNQTTYQTKLVHVKKPILRIPNLCIHLRSPEEREIFKINKEDNLMPVLTEQIKQTLDTTNSSNENNDSWKKNQPIELINLLANELNVNSSNIINFELSLYDTQNASFSGLEDEFIVGSRIDNLASCYAALDGLINYTNSNTDFINDEDISMIALFDHEEVGSQSQQGAGSSLMNDAIIRITNSVTNHLNTFELSKISIAKSMILSVDMAHAVHPNYASKHDKHHSPTMNSGLVIKTNVNQRYSSNGITSLIIREIGLSCEVNVQEFSVRNDCPCGSTISPIVSAITGIRAVDIGMPQLSMHSIREMMGTKDLTYGCRIFHKFFKSFRAIDDNFNRNHT